MEGQAGPALLKKQNVDWGYQFLQSSHTQFYKPKAKKGTLFVSQPT
jgi:hypothetical protein